MYFVGTSSEIRAALPLFDRAAACEGHRLANLCSYILPMRGKLRREALELIADDVADAADDTADLDLFVYRDGELVDLSASGAADEQVTMLAPAAARVHSRSQPAEARSSSR